MEPLLDNLIIFDADDIVDIAATVVIHGGCWII